jgi:PTS system nitrogen regulatory IIA component
MSTGIQAPLAFGRTLHTGSAVRSLFHPQRVVLGTTLRDTQSALETIGRLAQRRGRPSAREITEWLARREARGSTAVGGGAALPHAHVPRLRSPVAVYLHDQRGIPFGAADGIPVSQILALLVPQPASAAHFELLDRLTRHFADPVLRDALARCTGPDAVCELLSHRLWP